MTHPRDLFSRVFLGFPRALSGIRRAPILGSLVHRLSYQLVPSGHYCWMQVRAGLAEGLWLELNPRTGREYYEGKVEPAVQEVLRHGLRPGMVCYDIGANIGFFTLIAARLVGNEGRVVAFEPEPEIVPRLKLHIERNGFSNVRVVEAGVWSATGSATLNRADPSISPDRGTGSLSQCPGTAHFTSVPCIALDDFVPGAPPPHLIKCDVEGAEVEVLKGAARLLAEHRPTLVCEIHSEANHQSLRKLLASCGYRLSWVSKSHILALPQDG